MCNFTAFIAECIEDVKYQNLALSRCSIDPSDSGNNSAFSHRRQELEFILGSSESECKLSLSLIVNNTSLMVNKANKLLFQNSDA